jgi:D-glycero-D-manno-heptose 1,7-bisphosphate phosphatase
VPRRLDTPSELHTVFLDRDGVINRKLPEGEYVSAWEHFHLLPGASEAIRKLNQAGLRVIVVTNQRGIALGRYRTEDVNSLHAQLQHELSRQNAHIDAFYFCPHAKNNCNCRKPLTGLFEQAQAQFPGILPQTSLIIGDSLSDVEFGRNLGMRTIFIEGDARSREHQKSGVEKARGLSDLRFDTLQDAVEGILARWPLLRSN